MQDAASTVTEHHVIGSPVKSDNEASDGTAIASDGAVSTQVEVDDSAFSDDTESVAGEVAEPIVEEDPGLVEDIAPSRAWREALISLDTVDVMAFVRCRAVVMKSPPGFLCGAVKSVLRFALQEASAATAARDDRRLCRAWKLFMLAPRMFLWRRARGGLIPKNLLLERFAQFGRGEWDTLLIQSRDAAEEAAVARGRRRRTWFASVERRAERAQTLVALGEISSGCADLEGDSVAPGNQATLNSLRDESRRPRTLRDPLPDHLLNHQMERELLLDRDRFLRNHRCSRRGAAPGPTGMTAEHLRPLLDSVRDSGLLWKLGQSFARGQVPAEILPVLRLGRITALQKPSGGIRGIVFGDLFRRLVARTIAQQINPSR